MSLRLAALVVLSLSVVGCDYCIWNPTDPVCPPVPSVQSRICDHLVDCGRFDESERGLCIENHRTFTEDPERCLECVERTACDEVDVACVEAC